MPLIEELFIMKFIELIYLEFCKKNILKRSKDRTFMMALKIIETK